jgi:elongation factor Ts
MSISASDVKNLRDATGAGMMDCKKALTESGGDFEGAIEILRKQGQKLSIKRADREANEGVVLARISADKTKGIIIKLSSETDFVAKNDNFVKLAEDFAQIAIDHFPASLEDLLALPYQSITIGEKVTEQVGVIGEKIELAQYERLESPLIADYIHMGNKAAVLVALSHNGDEAFYEAGRDVAMQVAAMKPIAVNKEGVDASVIEKEMEIGKELARQEGKPEEMIEKIALGKLNKFYAENTLLSQTFVKAENKETVADFLKSKNKDLTVLDFKRVSLG